MKKILVLLAVALLAANIVQAQSTPSTDSIKRFVDRYIRNSAIDAFQNLRLNTALKWMTNRIDSAAGTGSIDTAYAVNDSTLRLTTTAGDTFNIVIRGVGGGGAGTTDLGTSRNTNSISITSSTGADITLDSATASLAGPLTAYRYRQLDTLIAGDSLQIRKKTGTDSVFIYTKPFPYTTTDSSYAFVDVSGGAASTVKKAFYYASDYGIYPDNTDITQKLKTLDSVMQVNGGGILIFDSACGNSRAYRIDGRFQLAHNGALVPYQSPRKWQGLGATRRGAGSYNLRGATVLDLRFTADSNSAQIDTRGIGSFEMTDMDLVHTVDVNRTRFFHTTSTVPVHRNLYVKGFNSGSGANEDFAIWGGKNGGGIDSTYNSPFQAYGAILENCVFDGIQSGVIMQRYCNNNWVRDNNFWNTCGGLAAIIINSYDNAQGDVGNVIEGNLIQTNSYTYAIDVSGGQNNTFMANSSFDGGAGLVSIINLRDNSIYNTVHAGKGESSDPYLNESAKANNWYYPSEQNGQVNMPFGISTNGSQSKYTGGTSPRIYQVGSTVNNSYIETFGATEAGIRINDDYVASWARTGTNRNMRLNGSGSNTYWSDGATFLSSASGRETWIGNDGFTFNFYTFNGVPHYRGVAFNLAADTRFQFSSNTGSAASGHDVLFGRDSIGQLRIFDAAGTGYGGLKLAKLYLQAPAQYAANYGSAFTNRSLVDKNYVDSSVAAIVVATEGTYTPTLTNVTNATSTSGTFHYQQIGSYIYVTGEITVDPTAAGDTQVDISLPVASTITNTYDLTGHGDSYDFLEPSRIYGSTANNRAILRFTAVSLTSRVVGVSFRYKYVAP